MENRRGGKQPEGERGSLLLARRTITLPLWYTLCHYIAYKAVGTLPLPNQPVSVV